MTSFEWEARRMAVVNQMTGMNDLARREEREFTAGEQMVWDQLESDEIRLRRCRDESRRLGR